jgi:hypothetical protein
MIDDGYWAAIKAAALPYRPDAVARAKLGDVLAAFAGLAAPNPEAIRRERERWGRLCKPIQALHPELKQLYLDIAKGKLAQEKGRGGRARRSRARAASSLLGLLFALEAFAIRAETNMRGFEVWAPWYRRQQNPARDVWLYPGLFEIWTKHFGGPLGYSTSEGRRTGPLINFLKETTALVLDPPPGREALRDAVNKIPPKVRRKIERWAKELRAKKDLRRRRRRGGALPS